MGYPHRAQSIFSSQLTTSKLIASIYINFNHIPVIAELLVLSISFPSITMTHQFIRGCGKHPPTRSITVERRIPLDRWDISQKEERNVMFCVFDSSTNKLRDSKIPKIYKWRAIGQPREENNQTSLLPISILKKATSPLSSFFIHSDY